MKLKNISKKFRILALALAISVIFPMLTSRVLAAGTYSASHNGTKLALYRGQSSGDLAFSVKNMLPGDRVSGSYPVQVSYRGTLTLHFHADVRKDSQILAEVLKCRLSIGGRTLYDGLMKDMPTSVDYALPQNSGSTKTITYDILVYLDTSVGNRYQNRALTADFRWWVDAPEGSDGSLTPPSTADSSHIFLWAGLCAVSFGALMLVLVRRKREKEVTSWQN